MSSPGYGQPVSGSVFLVGYLKVARRQCIAIRLECNSIPFLHETKRAGGGEAKVGVGDVDEFHR